MQHFGFSHLGRWRILAVVLVAAALAFVGAGQASANQPITVCPSGCDYTTIQHAVDNAPNGATIHVAHGSYSGFKVPGTNASLTSLTVHGAGGGQTVINTVGLYGPPLVSIDSGQSVTITGVTITGGTSGGVSNNGTLELDSSADTGNTSPAFVGAIDNGGTLTLKNSPVHGNPGGGPRGGI